MSNSDDKPASPSLCCTRRGFLLATATTAAGALLAACAGGGQEPVTVEASDVPVGGSIFVGPYIIAQPTEGVFHAYSAVCPHAGSKITIHEGTTVTCPKHGSSFDTTDGSVIQGPSRDPLTSVGLKESESTLTVG